MPHRAGHARQPVQRCIEIPRHLTQWYIFPTTAPQSVGCFPSLHCPPDRCHTPGQYRHIPLETRCQWQCRRCVCRAIRCRHLGCASRHLSHVVPCSLFPRAGCSPRCRCSACPKGQTHDRCRQRDARRWDGSDRTQCPSVPLPPPCL